MNGGHYNPHHDYVMKEKAPDHVSRTYMVFNLTFYFAAIFTFTFVAISLPL